jgi:uncharacterized membrane protein YfcA
MADALASGASVRKDVGVQVPPRPRETHPPGYSMDQSAWQVLLASIFSGLIAAVAYRLGRKGRLSFRYAVGWLALAAVGVFAGAFIPVVSPVADWLEISPAALVAVGAILLLVSICIQLSISISGLQEQNRRLAEKLAILEERFTDKDSHQ